jgi:predicted transposase/invertase (TIGR01784 family)
MKIKERYIDPFTDFGFKKLFGSESHKELLIDFLNELLKGHKRIQELTYAKNEHLGQTSDYRKAIFDLYCEGEKGEKFIIELQKVAQQFFKDRSIYYATFPIQEQAQKGEYWDYQLKEIYTIGIMDFAFDDKHPNQFKHEVKLIEINTKEVFYDKLTFIYLEMTKFRKQAEELETHFDRWMYLLKNLNKFSEIPDVLQERVFKKVFELAEVANLNEEEMNLYESSLKDKRDWKNAIDTAIEKGMAKGIKEGVKKGIKEGVKKGIEEGRKQNQIKIARQMKQKNMPYETIAELTQLFVEEIEKL